jgi:hypothetical protein
VDGGAHGTVKDQYAAGEFSGETTGHGYGSILDGDVTFTSKLNSPGGSWRKDRSSDKCNLDFLSLALARRGMLILFGVVAGRHGGWQRQDALVDSSAARQETTTRTGVVQCWSSRGVKERKL